MINQQEVGTLDPNLSVGSGTRYPNQFFDLAQQYMPPTIKELFRWCTFYFYNSPLIGSALGKISRYPITDLIFEDEHESTRNLWSGIINNDLKMTLRLMEVNLDYYVYGNAFMSVHMPFTRFLICKLCKYRAPISQCKWSFETAGLNFHITCGRCKEPSQAQVHDVPYKDRKGVRIIRWNPENIQIKYNEYTGRRIYMYAVPYKLKQAIQRGDKDILEDLPLIVIDAIKQRRMIRFSNDNFFHMRRPTLAEQDQGWGKPLIIHVLKDMYYLYTLRRAQEAIAMEHIVPFDMIYPMPNAQQDPYIHTTLADWRVQIEEQIRQHRRDPNYKAVIPVPVGFGRLGGDGKAMLLTPELNYLTQTIVGGMGIQQDLLYGTMTYSGASVTLRMLENDFIQNRIQLLDFVNWVVEKVRVWNSLPKINKIRFSDFRMADDVQRTQQIIGMNAAGKLSDQTLLSEMGFNYDQEMKKRLEELYLQNYMQDIIAKGQAKSQGEAMLITARYGQKMQAAGLAAGAPGQPGAAQPATDAGGQVPGGQPGQDGSGGSGSPDGGAQGWQKALPPALTAPQGGVDMRPLPEKLPPRRAGAA